jgi:large subunit ribosomal protein L9
MEVILLEKISGLGNIGSIVTVKPGFARNYLIPLKKVLRATPGNKQIVEQKKALLEQQNIEKKVAAESNAETLKALKSVIIRQAGEDGRLYGSITAKDIAKSILNISGIIVYDETIRIDNKIKAVGPYKVVVILHPDVSLNFDVIVARSEEEAAVTISNMIQ